MDTPRGSDLLALKARSAFQAARQLAEAHPDSSASRSYYAVYCALRWRYGGDIPRGHGGAVSVEVLERVGLRLEDSHTIYRLYVRRRTADYSDAAWIRTDEARDSVAKAEDLLRRLGVELR